MKTPLTTQSVNPGHAQCAGTLLQADLQLLSALTSVSRLSPAVREKSGPGRLIRLGSDMKLQKSGDAGVRPVSQRAASKEARGYGIARHMPPCFSSNIDPSEQNSVRIVPVSHLDPSLPRPASRVRPQSGPGHSLHDTGPVGTTPTLHQSRTRWSRYWRSTITSG